jgi:uncharacterized protein
MSPHKPSENEEDYFRRLETEKLEKRRQHAAASKTSAERARCLNKCPKCGVELLPITYQGVVVDKCPECRGTWLDHGELRLILEREQKHGGGFLSDVVRTIIGGKKEESPL